MPGQEWNDVVFPHVLGKVFHATRPFLLKSILRSGKIVAGNRKMGFRRQNTYAKLKGYISFFDFHRSLDDIKDHLWKCHPASLGREQALLLLKQSHWSSLIPNDQAQTEVGYTILWLPLIEVWSAEAVPVEAIESIIRVRCIRPARAPGELDLAKMLKAASLMPRPKPQSA